MFKKFLLHRGNTGTTAVTKAALNRTSTVASAAVHVHFVLLSAGHWQETQTETETDQGVRDADCRVCTIKTL